MNCKELASSEKLSSVDRRALPFGLFGPIEFPFLELESSVDISALKREFLRVNILAVLFLYSF